MLALALLIKSPAPVDGMSRFGVTVAESRDWNADGVPDLLVGDPARAGGCIYVCSGKDGAFLFERVATYPDARFGRRILPIGDVDGGGQSDFVVSQGEGQGNQVWVVSGESMATIRTHTARDADSWFGFAACAAPDLDGDGRGDYIITDVKEGPDQRGAAHAYSSKSGEVLWTAKGAPNGLNLGCAVTCGADSNGDGIGDILVSYVAVVSGKDGKELRRMSTSASIPTSVGLGCGIRPGAGIESLRALVLMNNGTTASRNATIVDSKTLESEHWTVPLGEQRDTLYPTADHRTRDIDYITAIASVDDVNGDGVPEVVLVQREYSFLYLLSGRDASLLGKHRVSVWGAGCWLAGMQSVEKGKPRVAVGIGSQIGATGDEGVIVVELPTWRELFTILPPKPDAKIPTPK